MEAYDLTLYHKLPSRSLRVVWLAAEIGILNKIKVEEVDLMKGDQYQGPFRKLNKMSAVPALILTDKKTCQDTVMTESAAICMFLTDNIPNGSSLKPEPSNTLGMAAYYRFIALASASIDSIMWQIRLHEQLLPEGTRVPAVAQMARTEFAKKVIPALEDTLGKDREYICEPFHNGFSTADIMVGYCCYWANFSGLLDDSPILQRYLARVKSRTAFKTASQKRSNM